MSPSPTRIATAEELDALPPGTVIRDDEGTGYAVNSSAGTWGAAGTGGLWDSSTIVLVMHAPFTVLHDPAAPPVSDTAAESGAPTRVECLAAASALDGVVLMLDCDDCPEDLARLADQWRDQASKTPEPPDTAAPSVTPEQRTILARTLATRFGMRHADLEGLGWYKQADAVLAALGLTVTSEVEG